MKQIGAALSRRDFMFGLGGACTAGLFMGEPGYADPTRSVNQTHKFLVMLMSSQSLSPGSEFSPQSIAQQQVRMTLASLGAASRIASSYSSFPSEYQRAYAAPQRISFRDLYLGAKNLTPRDSAFRSSLDAAWQPDIDWLLGADALAASYLDPPLGLALSVGSLIAPIYEVSWNKMIEDIPQLRYGQLRPSDSGSISVQEVPGHISQISEILRSGLYDAMLSQPGNTVSRVAAATGIPFDKSEADLRHRLASYGLPGLPSPNENAHSVSNRYLAAIAAYARAGFLQTAELVKKANTEQERAAEIAADDAARNRWLVSEANISATISLGAFALRHILQRPQVANDFVQFASGSAMMISALANPLSSVGALERLQQASSGAGLVLGVMSGGQTFEQQTLKDLSAIFGLLARIRREMLEGFASIAKRLDWIAKNFAMFLADYAANYQDLREELKRVTDFITLDAEYQGEEDRIEALRELRKRSADLAITRDVAECESYISSSFDFALHTSQEPEYFGVTNFPEGSAGVMPFVQAHGFEYSFATINALYRNSFGTALWSNPFSPYAWKKGGVEAVAGLRTVPLEVRKRFLPQLQQWATMGSAFVGELASFDHKSVISAQWSRTAAIVWGAPLTSLVANSAMEFLKKQDIDNLFPVFADCDGGRFGLEPGNYSLVAEYNRNVESQCPPGVYATTNGGFPLYENRVLMAPSFIGRKLSGPDIFSMARTTGLFKLEPTQELGGPSAAPLWHLKSNVSVYKITILDGELEGYTSSNPRWPGNDFNIVDFNYDDGRTARIYNFTPLTVLRKGDEQRTLTAVDLFNYCKAHLYQHNSSLVSALASYLTEDLRQRTSELSEYRGEALKLKLALSIYLYSIGVDEHDADRIFRDTAYPQVSPGAVGDLMAQRAEGGFSAEEAEALKAARTKHALNADLSNVSQMFSAYLSNAADTAWTDFIAACFKEMPRKHEIQENLDRMALFRRTWI